MYHTYVNIVLASYHIEGYFHVADTFSNKLKIILKFF